MRTPQRFSHSKPLYEEILHLPEHIIHFGVRLYRSTEEQFLFYSIFMNVSEEHHEMCARRCGRWFRKGLDHSFFLFEKNTRSKWFYSKKYSGHHYRIPKMNHLTDDVFVRKPLTLWMWFVAKVQNLKLETEPTLAFKSQLTSLLCWTLLHVSHAIEISCIYYCIKCFSEPV